MSACASRVARARPARARARPRRARARRAGARASGAGGAGEDDKAALRAAAAGTRNGTDATDAQRADVAALVARVEAANPTAAPADADLAGTAWELVYTSSLGTSSGKVGPLVGRVTQLFDESGAPEREGARGRAAYRNVVDWSGVVTVTLAAAYERVDDANWEVEFLDTTFEALGGLLSKRVAFPPGRVGTWRLTYVDVDTRVLYAKGGSAKEENVFVMRRVES